MINLDTIFNWRNENQIIPKLQEYEIIPKNGIKCQVLFCNGYMKLTEDNNVSDGVRWYCDGKIIRPKIKTIKCQKR